MPSVATDESARRDDSRSQSSPLGAAPSPRGGGACRANGARPDARRLDYLDGLRALAALYVLVSHVFVNVVPIWDARAAANFEREPWSPLGALFLFARYAVDVFIVLSGFCLMLPVARSGSLSGGAGRFYAKRVRRIIPPYYAAILVCALVMTVAGLQHITWRDVAVHMALINDFAGNNSINGAFWSIAVECHIYLFFPLLVWAAARWGMARTVSIAVLASAAVYFATFGKIGPLTSPHYVGLFAMGMAACSLVNHAPADRAMGVTRIFLGARWMSMVLLGGLVIASALLRSALWRGTPVGGALDILAGACAAAAMVAAADPGGSILRRVLEWRPLVWIGGFSYSVYLIHGPLIQVVRFRTPIGHLPPVEMLGALLILTPVPVVALSYLFHLAFERPFMRSPTRSAA